MSERLAFCTWCGRHNVNASGWEQKGSSGEYQRLCIRCAGRRLRNPWNALLAMRKIEVTA